MGRPIGFSTGAVAQGDVCRALRVLANRPMDAVELSALRTAELAPLMALLPSLDLRRYRYIAVHAPSQFTAEEEPHVIGLLQTIRSQQWPIIVHPDTIHDVRLWATFGHQLYVENMDRRKHTGRSVAELDLFFAQLPKAGLCFDVAHARQFDSSMTEAYRLLRVFRLRVRQVHLSDVATSGRHARLSDAAVRAFQEVANHIPPDAPIILESPVNDPQLIADELHRAYTVFNPVTTADAI